MSTRKRIVFKDGKLIGLPIKRKKAKKNVGAHYDSNQERWGRAEREKRLPPKQLTYQGKPIPPLPREADLPPMPQPSYQPPRFATESRVGVPEFTPGSDHPTPEFIAMLESLQGLTVVLAGPEGNSWLLGIANNGKGEIRSSGLFDFEPWNGSEYGHVAIVPDSIESVIFAPFDPKDGRASAIAAKHRAAAIILTDAFESV